MDNKGPVDVRIIVEGASDVESVSRALQRVSLGAKYHITISSIVPTTSLEIAMRAVEGADIVLIATDVDQTGRELADKFREALKGHVGHIERMKLPYGHDVEYLDPDLIREEIENAIIRAGLQTLSGVKNLRNMKESLEECQERLNELVAENSALRDENIKLLGEVEDGEREAESLKEEIKVLEEKLKVLEEDYSRIKTRFSEIKDKELLETFSIGELWSETFGEEPDDPEKIYFVTDHIKPEGIILGQGFIAAPSREDAVEWLRIVKSALVFTETDDESS
ncbi:topoisomerase [Methanothermobacter marburgensis]|uniref:TOPRIM domain-containing protein n=1 Tax=Methanothermobacter marburgensis (strain ATCC BAA-927 / DSM 2133 / JCM 14651 / NBRC 100331 / OCM 82 / Marburg) TaxID=79929 RepID=D9PWM3_METTM|nr:toprim domain-containing protein [Methanothermobacter marburgensis]ADL58621.1 TOPRIM domain-containing protein [Methanothermobacter marburgensis str. Marburg]WBF09208.1 topoisomerase [Methanothermobacter marburgensis]